MNLGTSATDILVAYLTLHIYILISLAAALLVAA